MEGEYSEDIGEKVIAQLRELIEILEKLKLGKEDAKECTPTCGHKHRVSK